MFPCTTPALSVAQAVKPAEPRLISFISAFLPRSIRDDECFQGHMYLQMLRGLFRTLFGGAYSSCSRLPRDSTCEAGAYFPPIRGEVDAAVDP